MAEITQEQFDKAADKLAKAKASGRGKQQAAEALAELRTKFRIQEEAAGRRSGLASVSEE